MNTAKCVREPLSISITVSSYRKSYKETTTILRAAKSLKTECIFVISFAAKYTKLTENNDFLHSLTLMADGLAVIVDQASS